MRGFGELVRYGLVGGISTVLTYGLFMGGIAMGLHYLAAATVASCTSVLVGYFLNRNFTFGVPGYANLRELSAYLGVFAVQYVLAMSGYRLLIGELGFSATLAFIINNAVVAVITFLLLRAFAFRNRNSHMD